MYKKAKSEPAFEIEKYLGLHGKDDSASFTITA